MLKPWEGIPDLTKLVVLLGYSASVSAPVAVKFNFALGGFLATFCAYLFASYTFLLVAISVYHSTPSL